MRWGKEERKSVVTSSTTTSGVGEGVNSNQKPSIDAQPQWSTAQPPKLKKGARVSDTSFLLSSPHCAMCMLCCYCFFRSLALTPSKHTHSQLGLLLRPSRSQLTKCQPDCQNGHDISLQHYHTANSDGQASNTYIVRSILLSLRVHIRSLQTSIVYMTTDMLQIQWSQQNRNNYGQLASLCTYSRTLPLYCVVMKKKVGQLASLPHKSQLARAIQQTAAILQSISLQIDISVHSE